MRSAPETTRITPKYRFWVAADDDGELWLSPNEKAADKEQLCRTAVFTAPQEWDKDPRQESKEVKLVAGRRYYLEVLMKQSGGGECLAVAWEGPGRQRDVVGLEYLELIPSGEKVARAN